MIRLFARASSGRRSKWVVIAVWIAVLAALVPKSMTLSEVTTDQAQTPESLPEDSGSARVAATLRDRFPQGQTLLALLVYSRPERLSDADRAVVAADATEAAKVEGVGRVVPPFGAGSTPGLVARNGKVVFTAVPLTSPKSDERTETIEELRKLGTEGARGMQVRVTGAAAVQSDLTTTLEQTDAALLLATGALVLFLLIMIYRAPLIAMLPLVVVGISYTIATGVVHLGAEAFDTTIDRTAVTLLAILMFGAGTDYCLLLVARYSTELRRDADKHGAISKALVRAGPAIAASGLVVAGALMTLLAARLNLNQVFGPVNAAGIVIGMLAALTLLPAMLAVVGRAGFWPSRSMVSVEAEDERPQLSPLLGALPDFKRDPAEIHPAVRLREGVWRKVGVAALRRPLLTLLACGALLAVCALGILQYSPEVDVIGQFRKTTDSTKGFDQLRTGFPPGTLYPNTVLVEREDGPVAPADIGRVQAAVRAVPGVATVSDPTARSTDGRAATVVATFADDPFEEPAQERIDTIRSRVGALRESGLSVLVGDGTALRVDYGDAAGEDQKRVVPLVLLVITLTLVALLRAVVAPLYLLASTVLSFLATLGISLVVFDTVFGEPRVDPAFPLFAFIFLVALGVDYNIFLMDRVREEARRHGTEEGVLRALVATGPVITSAGIVLAGTFCVLMTLPLDLLLEIGFSVALGVLIDTFLVRTLIVPALVKLFGESSWWPGRLRSAPEPPPPPAAAPGEFGALPSLAPPRREG